MNKTPEDSSVTATDPAPARPPASLDGLRVLDLSRVVAGPLCAQMLADHGAQVDKVEPPGGDESRRLGPPFDESGDAAYFGALNRGKRSLALDLSRPAGRAVLERLLVGADVVIENFLPGTMEKWGLGYADVLSARYPRLIYCSVSGFGADGPLGGLPGYDAVLQAMCGLMSINGTPESGPLRIGVPIVDYLTGCNATVGVLLALAARQRTGLGQRVEATLFDAGLALLMPHASNWLYSGSAPQLLGSAHPNIVPYDSFKAGDGELFLGIVSDAQFRRFCSCVEREDLASDARFADNAARLANRELLRAEIERILAGQSVASLCEDLMRRGIPAGPVNTVPQALTQPHAMHRRMLLEQDGYRCVGIPVTLSDTPGRVERRPPRLAEHSEVILTELGYDAAGIAALRADGALPAPA